MVDFLLGLLGLAALIGLFCLVYAALNWVLGPLDRAAKNRRYRVQFSLADFLCLFVEVQLALGGPALVFRSMEGTRMGLAAFVSIVIVAVVLLVWWTGVRTLSAAGVHGTFARALTLSIGIPIGFASSVAIPLIGLATFASLDSSHQLPRAGLFLLLGLADALLIVALGFVTRHIVAGARPARETTPRQDFVRPEPATAPTSPPRSEA